MKRLWQILTWAARSIGNLVGVYTWKVYASEVDLQKPIPGVQRPINFEFGIASTDDLRSIQDRLHQTPGAFSDDDKESFLAAVKRGNTCFVAKTRGVIAGYTWVNFGDVPLFFGAAARYPPDTAHTFNALVFPEFRGQKIFQALANEVYTYLKNKGYRYACNLIIPDNIPAVKAKQNAGARIDSVRFTKLPYCRPRVSGKRRFELVPRNAKNFSQTSGEKQNTQAMAASGDSV